MTVVFNFLKRISLFSLQRINLFQLQKQQRQFYLNMRKTFKPCMAEAASCPTMLSLIFLVVEPLIFFFFYKSMVV